MARPLNCCGQPLFGQVTCGGVSEPPVSPDRHHRAELKLVVDRLDLALAHRQVLGPLIDESDCCVVNITQFPQRETEPVAQHISWSFAYPFKK